MLKFHSNPYDTFKELKSAMGLDPHPLWMLIFDSINKTYSAVNYKDDEDICNYSLKNNLIGVCLVEPACLIEIMESNVPHIICLALFEWCTLKRPDPEHIFLIDFLPPKGYIVSFCQALSVRSQIMSDVIEEINSIDNTPIPLQGTSAQVPIDCASVPFIGSAKHNGTDPVDKKEE